MLHANLDVTFIGNSGREEEGKRLVFFVKLYLRFGTNSLIT